MSHLALYRPPFPAQQLPGLLGKVVQNLCATGGDAAKIIGTVLIAIASLLTQGLANVMWPNGQILSIGANGFVVAPSGSGKSRVLKILMRAIEQYLSMLIANGSRPIDLLIEDATREALVRSLHEWPVAGVISDEAGLLGRLLREAATLAKLVDNSPLRSARISTGRLALLWHRLSMLLMEQPDVFKETKVLLGPGKGGVGLINRFFVAQVTDFQAHGSPHEVGLSAENDELYEKRVHELLDLLVKLVEQGIRKLPVIKLSADAAKCLIELDREARQKCKPGSPWSDYAEYILRHAERVLRLAGVFHVFEYGTDGEISLETLQRAESIGDWYVDSFVQIFYEPPQVTQVEVDADALERLLIQNSWAGASIFRQSEMRTQSLNVGLTPTRFTRALALLCERGRASMVTFQNKPWIALHLSRLPQF